MRYKFAYFYEEKGEEFYEEIDADNDQEAVCRFIENIGNCQFSCIKADGTYFSDEDFTLTIKNITENGC